MLVTKLFNCFGDRKRNAKEDLHLCLQVVLLQTLLPQILLLTAIKNKKRGRDVECIQNHPVTQRSLLLMCHPKTKRKYVPLLQTPLPHFSKQTVVEVMKKGIDIVNVDPQMAKLGIVPCPPLPWNVWILGEVGLKIQEILTAV